MQNVNIIDKMYNHRAIFKLYFVDSFSGCKLTKETKPINKDHKLIFNKAIKNKTVLFSTFENNIHWDWILEKYIEQSYAVK